MTHIKLLSLSVKIQMKHNNFFVGFNQRIERKTTAKLLRNYQPIWVYVLLLVCICICYNAHQQAFSGCVVQNLMFAVSWRFGGWHDHFKKFVHPGNYWEISASIQTYLNKLILINGRRLDVSNSIASRDDI